MAHEDFSPRKHFNAEMSLRLVSEEAMCLDTVLERNYPTARVQINLEFEDDNKQIFAATRIVKIRLKLDCAATDVRLIKKAEGR